MEFYSYLYLREDETPYYAGKGSGKRAFKGRHRGVYPPKDTSRIILFPMLNETEAFESEIALIELFGRKDLGTGCLRNRTNGGEGVSGLKWSPEQVKQQTEHLKRIAASGGRSVPDNIRLMVGRRNSESGQIQALARSGIGGRRAVEICKRNPITGRFSKLEK